MNFFENELNELKNNNNYRNIKNIEYKNDKYIFCNGKKYLNLSSNNYLSIGNNKELEKEFFDKHYKNESFSSSSSRLLTGNEEIYFELETLLAKLFKKERALLFNSGYAANVGILSALLNKNDVVFSDKLNHASIIDGIKLSESTLIRYNHLNYEQLEEYLKKDRDKYKKSIIISESLFSMDGDFFDIEKLMYLKHKYDCILIVDESHSFGVYGKNDAGCCEKYLNDVDLIISGFGKACGSFGGFVVGDKNIIEYLINKARSLIFSTSLPPINIAWTKFVIENIFPKINNERQHLIEISKYFKDKLEENVFKNNSNSYIIPIIFDSEDKLINMQNKLLNNSFYVLPIRYPTVPKNAPRLRLSLISSINKNDVDNFCNVLRYE